MEEFKNIFVLGIGLIGGSMARDLRRILPQATFYGIDANDDHLDEAVGLGVIDHSSRIEALSQADLVILSIPVDQANLFLPAVLDAVESQALVLDVGSTKGSVCDAVKDHPKRSQFLAAHPIAGTEFSGPSAAIEYLFQHKTMILCEVEQTREDLLDKAMQVFEALEMNIRYMNPHSHDKHIAYVSHLSHISSFMLGKTVIEKEKNEKDIFDMAGSGFASTVRLAKSNPATWTPIFKENKANVLESLTEYINNLTHFKNVLEADDFEEVYNEMHNTNHIKSILKGLS
ncbi:MULTISPECIES: prephenate dehydrogenase [unclassified Leeuwenhoekiella]|uniref:prephenate dehydrogenase n=1 Tax=unclassified Leeuwenhoekiella TaxID=2615029 RepID=UPI000C433837|nr:MULTISPECIES: prephenate dehydrogenase [unclassified Leeuwenhoekiella]MAW96468.1 prephenate dehydrogenase [Leeuwenhoekiella sp.]MBA81355.1 prephenate dehydrogenase [Leeuwenhoekiella sp.]